MAGPVVWLTGLPGAGKSTVARLVAEALQRQGRAVTVLDGDEIRRTISRDLGYSAADRDENVRRVIALASEHRGADHPVLVALVSPLVRQREAARRVLEPEFAEVHVRASLRTCVSRDPKGLYERALAGQIAAFTGVSSPYEAPREPELVLDTECEAPGDSAAKVLALLARLEPRATRTG